MALLAGVWLSLLYSATVMPATVWVIQLTVSRSWGLGLLAGAAMALGQLPWIWVSAGALAEGPHIWRTIDPWLRLPLAGFLFWMAIRIARTGPVKGLRVEVQASARQIAQAALKRSLLMPWRLAVWFCLIFSVGAHLRGPGWEVLPGFLLGALTGQLLWHGHFVAVAALFGKRVPEPICLKSMNKFRLLGTLVTGGLGLLILLPLALTFSYLR